MFKLKIVISICILSMLSCVSKSVELPIVIQSYSSISEFLNILESLPVAERECLVEQEIDTLKNKFTFPEVNQSEVLFFYRDIKTTKVSLYGDLNHWSESGLSMERVEGSSIYYLKENLETNARIKYKFKVKGRGNISDPLNPKFSTSVFGTDSLLEMGDYYYEETFFNKDINHGEIVVKNISNNTVFGSKEQKRKIQIYLPPGYSDNIKYKTLYFCDGSDYVDNSRIPNVLDYIIDKKEIEPVVAIFVDWIERDREYISPDKNKYLEFLTNELIPMMEGEFSLLSDREGRVAIGPSNGGDFVSYVGAVASGEFKYIFNQSGSPNFRTFGMEYEKDDLPIKVVSVVGKYEKSYNLNSARKFHGLLKNNPTILGEKYILYPQGHTYRMWGDSFREGILWLLSDKDI